MSAIATRLPSFASASATSRSRRRRTAQILTRNGVELSFHPAGHVLGSAQVRVASKGEIWVASGDYKLESDGVSPAFEPVRCHAFITELTFGLPIYRWRPQADIFAAIDAWRRENIAAGRASILFAYALGKAQRLLAGVDPALGPIVCHGAVEAINALYREAGIALPPTRLATEIRQNKRDFARALIVAPPSAAASPWLKRFGDYSDALASGWMQVRGNRRRRGLDRGFALSDHADWPGLIAAIEATGAERILVTHGYTEPLTRYLREKGLEARALQTAYGDDEDVDDGAPRRRRPKREGLCRALPKTRFRHLDPRQAGGDGRVFRRRQGRAYAMGERGLDGLFPERGQAAPDRAVPPSLAPRGRRLGLPGLAMR